VPRARTRPILNQALADALAQTCMGYAALAERINRVAAENGLVLSCDASSLSKWTSGQTPHPQTRAVVVETLRRLLEHDVTACALGWEGTTTDDDPWAGDAVARLTTLGRDDMLRRRTLLYSLAATTIPASLAAPPSRPGPARRAGTSDVKRIRTMTSSFGDADDLYGGGHARTAAAAYLAQEVTPLLHGTTGAARPAVFTAAGELAYLVGWMAADAGQSGLAQRYYIQAIRLADEAGNPLLRSSALRSLAVQAVELGHGNRALDLAEAAQDGLRGGAPARTRAWVTGMCAEAIAAAHTDKARAFRLLSQAEANLEHADSPSHMWTSGNYRRESFEHQVGLTLVQLGDHAGAEEHFALSIASRRLVERRTKALIVARLALAQIHRHAPDAAAYTLLEATDSMNGISSARLRTTLASIRDALHLSRTSKEARIQEADQFLARLLRYPAAV